jgi:hypothetical protein
VEGGGAGAGGFCANATGPRSPIASASSTKVRMRGFTDLLLGRARQSRKFSAQVSSSQGLDGGLPKRMSATGWISLMLGALCSAVPNLDDSGPRTTELGCCYQ